MTSDKRMSDGMLERLRATIKAVAGKPIPVMLRKDASPEVHAYFEVALTGLPNLLAEIDALRADLAAARRVEDQEVADLIESLETYTPGSLASRVSSAHHTDIVRRLSAAKEEAERMAKRFMSEAEDWKWAAGDREKERDDALERLVQAERERDRARTDALEEAAKVAEASGRAPDCPYGIDKPGDPTWDHTEEDNCPVCGLKANDSWRGCTVYANNRIAKDIRALKSPAPVEHAKEEQ